MKITFMGAGSTVFVRNIIGDCLLTDCLKHSEFALYDIDKTRLEESKTILDMMNKSLGNTAKITTYLGVKNRKDALRNATFVINAIQVGGYDPCTITDFEIPKKYGLRQTIGDTLGIGGIMRAFRTIPVVEDFCNDMNKVCPNAMYIATIYEYIIVIICLRSKDMKRLFSLFLSLVMLSSAVLCTDLSAYADSDAKSDSYFNQFTDGNETEEAINYIDDEIDVLFDSVIKQVFSGADNMGQYINNYDGQTPTYDFMALASGLISSALVGGNKADIISYYVPDYVPFDDVYYSYLDSINYNNCNFWTLCNISKTDFPDNPDVQQFADELSKYLDSNLNAYKSIYDFYNNKYNEFLEIENLILDNFLDEEKTIFYLTSDKEANELISNDGISISEFEKSYDVSEFIDYVQSIAGLYDSNLQINSLSKALYYCFSTPLVYIYPIFYSLGVENLSFDSYNEYNYFAEAADNNLLNAIALLTTSDDGYYTNTQKDLVLNIVTENEQNIDVTQYQYSITENDFVQLKEIFNKHLTKTATISAVNDSNLNDIIKYYFNNYLTNNIYSTLNSDFKNWTKGSSYTSTMTSLSKTIYNEIWYPYIINEQFKVNSKSLNLIDLFHEYGQYGCFIKDNLVCTENNKFDLDLSSNQSKEIWINIANKLINNIIENYIFSDTLIGEILNNVLNSLLSVDINLEKNLPNVYLRFAEKPTQTVLELLPIALTILDDVAVPVFFNAEGDNYYQEFSNLLLNENGLLYGLSQESESEIGLGQIGWDLNTLLPNFLDFILGYKSANDFGTYSEPYDSNVPRIFNVYIVDRNLESLKNSINDHYPLIKEIIIFAKEVVDKYLSSEFTNNVKLDKDGKCLNSGLNNIFAALPQLFEIIENNFAAKIELDKNAWTYLDEGTIVENADGSFENGLLKTLKNTAANPDSKTTLNILSNDFLAKVFHKIIFFGTALFTEENNLSKNAPFIFSVLNCFDVFGESSPLLYAINNAFDLNDSNYKFTLPEISGESVLFLLSNIEKIIDLIDYAEDNPNNSEPSPVPSPVLPDNYNSETIQSDPEEIILLIDNTFAKDINDLSSVIMKDLQFRLESKDDKVKAKAQDFADETEVLLNAYFDVINNNNVTNSNLNTVINGIYTVAEKYCDFTFASELGGVNPLSDFITKLVLGSFSPVAVSTNIDNTAIRSELAKYDTWDQLKKSKVELKWGLTGKTTVDFYNAVCNGFPRINKVADIIVNDTDLYSNYITAIYNKFEISLPEDSTTSSLSKIITPPLVEFKDTLDNGVFSSILLNFENIEYFGFNIDLLNDFINYILDLTVNEFFAAANTLLPNLISDNKINQNITSEAYFNAVSSFVNNIFVNVADSENILELKSIELKPYYYEIDITGLSKVQIYEQLFCKHLYTKTIVEPTCTAQGYTKYRCQLCGNEYYDDYVNELGHIGVTDGAVSPTCIYTGLTEGMHCSRCNEILVKQEPVDALGHSFSEYKSNENATCTDDGTKTAKCDRCDVTNTITDIGSALGHNWDDGVITKEPTCTQTGIKTFTCLRCSETKTETINKTEHLYTPKKVLPTCTEKGYTIYICNVCSTNYISDYVDKLGHDYSSDWTIDIEVSCTTDGSKSHHCSRCDSKTDITVIEAMGHSYGEWQTRKAATCTDNGIKYKTCSVCGNEEVLTTDSLGHNYEKWNITKEATVLCEGSEESSCTRCGNVETRAINKVEVDLDNTDKYGLVNFTIVNAQTKKPIKNAGIFISTENDGENTFFTDQNGKVSFVLPVGKQVVSAYAEGCLTRNLNINVTTGNNEIPLIGLSEKSTYDAKIEHHLMTSDEIADAGIDTSETENQHVYKYELKLEFEPEIDWFSLVYYMGENGELLGGSSSNGSSNSGGTNPDYVVDWVVDDTDNNKGHFNVNPKNGEEFSVYPVSEYFYLIIRGEVKWLKEMFDVEMLVINNSNTDTLENLSATLNLPEGLSLAAMSDYQQTLKQYIGNIEEGCSKSVHWYVRGDKAGSYSIEANLKGMVMPFEEEINDNFIADKALQVWAGNAMHLEFEFPDAAYYGDDYPITITLTNVSDTTLYNIRNFFQIEQGMEIYYSDGSSKKKIEKSQWDSIGIIKEFNPGDKIIIESTVNVFFKSEIMERELEKYIGIIDGIEQFIKGFKAVKEAFDIVDGLIDAVEGAITGIDLFIESSAGIGEKISLISTLKNTIYDFQSKYSKTGSATFDSAVKLANSGVGAILNALSENPDEWLENASEKDIKDLIDKVETLEKSISSEATAEDIKNFNIFDSLRAMVSAIPIRFAFKSIIMTEDENNTASIPWSYNQYNTGAHYFGVSDLGNYMTNITKAIMAEAYDEAVPSTLKLIPGIDDPLNYEDIKRQIIATENEIKQFQAKTATGDVSFKAYIVRNENTSIFSLKQKAFDDFIISCDNETAVLNDGVLTFTGNGIISITPTSLNGGTLYIEDSEGNTYTYEISVVKQHECSASEWHTVISPTADTYGFAVKCCDVCEDILDVELLSTENCTHNFDVWEIESDASCSSDGLKSRECSVCGYRDFKFIEKENHDYQVQSIEYADNKKITTYKCSVCGEIFATSLDCEAYLAAVETANALRQNGLEKYTDAAIEDFNSAIAHAKEIADLAENTDDFDNATRIVLSAISTLKESLLHFTITYITIIENDKTKTTFDVKYGDEFVVPKTNNAIIKITYNNGNGETDLPISNSIGFVATEDATVTVHMANDAAVNNSDTTKVTFLNMGGSIFAINYIANNTVINVLDKNISFGDITVSAPIVAFYDFIGWEVLSGNVNNPDGNDIVLKAAYEISDSRNICNIVGLNGVLVNGESSYLAHYDELVKISCSKGKKLAYTDNTGTEIYAYINGNTIYAPNSSNIYIKEVDNAIEAKSAIVGTYNENGRAGFNCQFSLPEDAVFVECGVAITTNNDIANNNFEIGTEGTSKFKSNTQGNNNEYSVSLKYSSSYYGKTLYGRSYLIYKDTDGNLCTVYSTVNSIKL